jgi:hypothetical protein
MIEIKIQNYPENITKINDIPDKSNMLIYLEDGVVPAIFNNFSDNILSFYGLDSNFEDRHLFTIPVEDVLLITYFIEEN